MKYSELMDLKEKLLAEAKSKVRREDFSSAEAYQKHVEGIEEGIIRFFTQSLLLLMESDAA